jgi:hypothetical protein
MLGKLSGKYYCSTITERLKKTTNTLTTGGNPLRPQIG